MARGHAFAISPHRCRPSTPPERTGGARPLPLPFLHGLSSGNVVPALEQFLGSTAGLSTSTVSRLAAQRHDVAGVFPKRSLKDTDLVYLWVDGIHLKVPTAGRTCACW